MEFPLYYYGRRDCDSTSRTNTTPPLCTVSTGVTLPCSATTGPAQAMPSPNFDTASLLHWMYESFGLTTRETVAVMGAHTLGTLTRTHSGIHGPNGWVDGNSVLNNEYYALLVGTIQGRRPSDTSLTIKMHEAHFWGKAVQDNTDLQNSSIPNRFVWTRRSSASSEDRSPLIMLNSDIALVRDLQGLMDESRDFTVACDFLDTNERGDGDGLGKRRNLQAICPHAAQTMDIVADFKLNNTQFLWEFRAALTKLFATGYALVCDDETNANAKPCLHLVNDTIVPPPVFLPPESSSSSSSSNTQAPAVVTEPPVTAEPPTVSKSSSGERLIMSPMMYFICMWLMI